jgi:hypothetical protein
LLIDRDFITHRARLAFSINDLAGAEETPTNLRVVSAVKIAARLTESGEAGGKSKPGKSFIGPGKDPITGARDANSRRRLRLSSIALELFRARELLPIPREYIGIGIDMQLLRSNFFCQKRYF